MTKRLIGAQKKLGRERLDALLISSVYNIGYLTGFFGFSKTEREGYVLLTIDHCYIFASGLNSEAVKKHIKSLTTRHSGKRSASRIPTESWTSQDDIQIELVEISPRSPLTKKALATIISKGKIRKLGFEKRNLTFAEYERLKRDLKVVLVPTEHVIEELRMIKDADEIAAIEKACKLGDKAFNYILTKIRPGVTEKELTFELELFIRNAGAELSFPAIVAFGANSAVPHHVTSDKGLRINDKFILLDFGVKVVNYCSDMTRTVFLGKASAQQRRMYQTVLEAQQKAIEFLTSYFALHTSGTKTVKASKVDKVARSVVTSNSFLTIPHSLGHGIGLEVHELPSISQKSQPKAGQPLAEKDVLKPNMVFSIEPGIYQPGVGGVRIEDLVALTPSGPRFLTNAQREIIEA